ncbi:hypothetical protein [Nonomuraea sp. NPDC001831]|uniref:hypothetical protein n=1 Tax=Nonomuraea sp. NPDC001831 TaxID=3364340 RepID=UPI003686C193
MFDEVMKLADRRFLVNAFLPCAAFILALTGLVALRALPYSVALWQRVTAAGLTAAVLVAALVVAFFAAAFVSAQTGAIIRWYEGGWSGPAGRLARAAGRRCHLRRLARLDPGDPADYDRIYHDYPLPSRPQEVQATRLGNILRNAESYPADRYGMETAVIWPRLHPLLPEPVSAALAAAKADMEFLLVVSALAATFCCAATGVLAATGTPVAATLSCLWLSGGLAHASYRGALGAARRYGGHLKVAVDLHHLTLLRHLDFPDEELRDARRQRDAYTSLALWWYRNVPPALQARPDADATGGTSGTGADLAGDDGPGAAPAGPRQVRGRWWPPAPSLPTIAAMGALAVSVVILLFSP